MCFCHVLCLCVTRPVPCVYLVCVCAGQLARLQVDMESLRDQREKTICSTREELSLAQEEVPDENALHTHLHTHTHVHTHMACTYDAHIQRKTYNLHAHNTHTQHGTMT